MTASGNRKPNLTLPLTDGMNTMSLRKSRLALFILLIVVALTCDSRTEAERVLIVDAGSPVEEDGDGDLVFRTITAAVESAVAGDRISVAPGRYDRALGERFPISIQSNLMLEGAGPSQTVISADGALSALRIQRASVVVTGFSVQGAAGLEASAVVVTGDVGQVQISGNVVQDVTAPAGAYAFGIRVYRVNKGRVVVANNAVQRVAGNGISVGHSGADVEVLDNRVSEITQGTYDGVAYSVGIAINASTGALVRGNDVSRATVGIGLTGSTGNTVQGNRVYDNLQQETITHILLTVAGISITVPGCGILVALGSHGNAILENELMGNGTGVLVQQSDENVIARNVVKANQATSFTLLGETAHGAGVVITLSNRNRVVENVIAGNGDTGIIIRDGGLNLISGNNITGHQGSGVLSYSGVRSAPNAIELNEILENPGSGISIKGGYSHLRRNVIAGNGTGVELMESAQAADHLVTENDIDGNGFGLRNEGDGVLGAELNWWGASDGPYHPLLNPTGQGDPVSDQVDFLPWRMSKTSP